MIITIFSNMTFKSRMKSSIYQPAMIKENSNTEVQSIWSSNSKRSMIQPYFLTLTKRKYYYISKTFSKEILFTQICTATVPEFTNSNDRGKFLQLFHDQLHYSPTGEGLVRHPWCNFGESPSQIQIAHQG